MSTTARSIVITDTKPTDVDALASQLVEQLKGYILKLAQSTKVHIGIVVSLEAGPPPTLTATLHGFDVANIRYIGTAPSEGDSIVVLVDPLGPQYVALGTLTS